MLLYVNPGECSPRRFLLTFSILFFKLLLHSSFLLCCFFSHIFLPICFVSFLSVCLICPCILFIDLLLEFFFVILEGPSCFLLLDHVPISFESPFWSYRLIYFFLFHSIVSMCIFLSLILSLVFTVSLFVLLDSFPTRVWHFCSSFFKEYQLYHCLV